jgi:AcrR family transcriptional regulator
MDDQGAAPADCTHAEGREALLAAALSLSGELGYRHVTAEAIAARAGRDIAYLYNQFSGPEECFALAYSGRAEPLLAALLDDCRRGASLLDGLSAALTALLDFAEAEPPLARALLVEVYVAGGTALRRHEQFLGRLSDAVADTRRERNSSRHVSPPLAADFIVGGLEEAVRRRLAQRRLDLLRAELPDLVALAAAPLEGPG